MTVSILIADDHQVVRLGLRTLLEAEPDFKVVGEAKDGLEAKALVDRLKPAVLVVDMMMPGLNGLEVIRHVGTLSPNTRTIVLSMQANEAYVLEALKHGAAGYILKQSDLNEVVRAVHDVLAGLTYLSPQLSQRAIESYREKAGAVTTDQYDALTAREREVLQLAAEGHTSAAIAERLVISQRTVEMHRANLMRKLSLKTQTDLVRYAMWRGILPNEP